MEPSVRNPMRHLLYLGNPQTPTVPLTISISTWVPLKLRGEGESGLPGYFYLASAAETVFRAA